MWSIFLLNKTLTKLYSNPQKVDQKVFHNRYDRQLFDYIRVKYCVMNHNNYYLLTQPSASTSPPCVSRRVTMSLRPLSDAQCKSVCIM